MKLFTTLLDLALLPVAIVKDVVCAIPIVAGDMESATRKQVEKIDEDLE